MELEGDAGCSWQLGRAVREWLMHEPLTHRVWKLLSGEQQISELCCASGRGAGRGFWSVSFQKGLFVFSKITCSHLSPHHRPHLVVPSRQKRRRPYPGENVRGSHLEPAPLLFPASCVGTGTHSAPPLPRNSQSSTFCFIFTKIFVQPLSNLLLKFRGVAWSSPSDGVAPLRTYRTLLRKTRLLIAYFKCNFSTCRRSTSAQEQWIRARSSAQTPGGLCWEGSHGRMGLNSPALLLFLFTR